jgi:hypothetical protein
VHASAPALANSIYANDVQWVSVVIPIVGIVVACGVPLVRYALAERYERTAIDVLQRVQQAQAAFRDRSGGYASDVASLTTPCTRGDVSLSPDVLSTLSAAGYALALRPAAGTGVVGQDCHGRDLVQDYYITAAPISVVVAARQAFAGRRDGRLYLFFDGVPPREEDMASGLATPLELRESFRIP